MSVVPASRPGWAPMSRGRTGEQGAPTVTDARPLGLPYAMLQPGAGQFQAFAALAVIDAIFDGGAHVIVLVHPGPLGALLQLYHPAYNGDSARLAAALASAWDAVVLPMLYPITSGAGIQCNKGDSVRLAAASATAWGAVVLLMLYPMCGTEAKEG